MIAIALLLSVAEARPIASRLDEVVATSEAIVVAEVLAPATEGGVPRLQVLRQLKGERRGIVAPIPGTGTPRAAAGALVVAFLGSDAAWSVVATPLPGEGIGGLLRVDGFYDFNAHLVDPGLATVAQIEGLVRGEAPTWDLRGPLLAVSDDGRAEVETGIEVRVRVDAAGAAAVDGLAIAGHAGWHLRFVPWHEPDLELVAHQGSPRPFTLDGTALGWRGDHVAVAWRVGEPDLLTAAEIAAYTRDPRAAGWRTELAIDWEDGSTWTWALGDRGRMAPLVGPDGPHPLRALSMAPERALRLEDRVIALGEAPGAPARRAGGAEGQLLRELLVGPIPVEVVDGVGLGARGRLRRVGASAAR